jgi:hypothetical protein
MKNFIILLFCTGISFASMSQNVVQGEYFIDTDLGFGNNTLVNFTPAGDGTFPLSITVSSYTPGFHKLYIRTKDDSGRWGLTARRNIEVLASESKTTIVTGEYFIDTDPGFGLATPITVSTPDSIVLQNFSAVTTGLSEGNHKLYGRLLDNQGKWSLTLRRNMEVYKSDTNKVLKAEYFFTTDEGFGNCASETFATPASDGSFVINIARNSIPADADTLFVRVRDDIEERWSLTQIQNGLLSVLPLTLLNFNAVKQNNVSQLTWRTAYEVNTAYFNVQRSLDGTTFTTVGKINAKENNSIQNDYTYGDDIAGLQAGKVLYRLQMVDNDGKLAYSKIVIIAIDANSLQISIHPNPANNFFMISNYGDIDFANAVILLRDLTGRTIITQKLNNAIEQRVNVSGLSKGMYIVSIVTNGKVQTQKIFVE